MYPMCERPRCPHYAFIFVWSPGRALEMRVCSLCTQYAIAYISARVPWWARIALRTSSAVVVEDIVAWRTASITAYDELRQLKGSY